jgi:hypothetical protein
MMLMVFTGNILDADAFSVAIADMETFGGGI